MAWVARAITSQVSCTPRLQGEDDHVLTLRQAYGKFSIKLIIPLLYIITCQGIHVFDSFFLKELVEYYKHHSLKEGFRTLDTTLQFPYKEPEHSSGQRGNRAGNSCEYCNLEYNLLSLKDRRHDNIKHLHSRFWNRTN